MANECFPNNEVLMTRDFAVGKRPVDMGIAEMDSAH
jgi:hypothetical protein